jgi:hypothetical protein
LNSFCTDIVKLFEHISGFLAIVERILEKHEEKKSGEKRE